MSESLASRPPPARRPWSRPAVRTTCAPDQATLLMCTGPGRDFDCGPVVGYPCCMPNAQACNACKP